MIVIVLPDISTESHLLERLHAGDEDAILDAYRAFLSPLYNYVRLRTGDPQMAEDIVSDVFVTMIESLGGPGAPRENLRAWLFAVARNAVNRHYGSQRHLPLTDLDEWLPAPPTSNPEAQAMQNAASDRVRHALRMLKAEQQEVLILRFGQMLSLKATADIMGKSVSAIKSLQFRALDTLRGILDETEANHG